jgi:flavin reductase (DIM6/NTAB) family NADH-FMN oxidoreductase RutF
VQEFAMNANATRAAPSALHGVTSAIQPFDANDFRRVAGCFATGVTILTTSAVNAEPIGITANSFSSVSLDPPLILFSIARKLYSLSAFEGARHFCVNVLHDGQAALAKQFAVTAGEKWRDVDYKDGAFGCRLLSDAAATLECEKYASYDGGDHVIFVGRVLSINADWKRSPLIFWRGKFATVAADSQEGQKSSK